MLFSLKGCGSVDGRFLKKYFSLLLLSNSSRDLVKLFDAWFLLGTKVKPRARMSSCAWSSVLDERLVMYLHLSSCFCVCLIVCL